MQSLSGNRDRILHLEFEQHDRNLVFRVAKVPLQSEAEAEMLPCALSAWSYVTTRCPFFLDQ